METQSKLNRSDNTRMDRKIRTIRFILLSIILYLLTDAIGRWFVPAQDSVPGVYTMMIWILCFITGALQFFYWRRISLKWLRWASAIAYVILFCLLLKWRDFYYYGGSTLIGYKFSVSIMPLWGFLIEATFTSFLRWYGNLIKRIFKLESINSMVFMFFMLIPVALIVMLFIGGYKLSGTLSDKGADIQQYIDRGYNRNHRFTVTSVLRTEETVRQLRKTNVNSSENSCHCYGTTFDISYFTYSPPQVGKEASIDKMRQILYQVAYDMKKQGRCYVKYEKQQTCLHITVR